MRGNFLSTALRTLSFVCLTVSANAAKDNSFLQKCFPKIDFTKSKIECVLTQNMGPVAFDLSAGKYINISGPTQFGKIDKNFNVEKISHLKPRLSDVGALDESVRFLGKSLFNGYVATMDFVCNQTVYAVVGIGKNEDEELPREHLATCRMAPLK